MMTRGASLIHPHEKSNLPGYIGYTPQLKYHCGHTYGYQTDRLNKEFASTRKPATAPARLKLPDLPVVGADDVKYVKQMVPGYTGFVPQHVFKYGQTYAFGTEDAISHSKYSYLKHAKDQDELRRTVLNRQPLAEVSSYPAADPNHPGVNMRYVLSFGKHFNERRDFTEPPIPGYKGYVPRKEEHMLGERYNVWTRHAYNHAADSIAAKKEKETGDFATINISKPISVTTDRLGSIYSKKLGMIPYYTGFVPQRNYDFGSTYGDSTRSMPVCADTAGYSLGKYNDAGKTITPTVIPVRI